MTAPEIALISGQTGFTQVIINTEDLPPVKLQENGILSVGAEAIEESLGIHADHADGAYWAHQLVEAMAALKFIKEQKRSS